MTFARIGEPGQEIPVIQNDGRSYDLRSITADIDAYIHGSALAGDAAVLGALTMAGNIK